MTSQTNQPRKEEQIHAISLKEAPKMSEIPWAVLVVAAGFSHHKTLKTFLRDGTTFVTFRGR